MKNKDAILKQLEGIKANSASQARFGSSDLLALQAGANAPLIATATGLLLEVALDMRDFLASINEHEIEHTRLLGETWDMVHDLYCGKLELEKPAPESDDVPVIHIANEDQINTLLEAGKLKGFENGQDTGRATT